MNLSVVIPALNEEKTVASCVRKARSAIERLGVEGEVLVVDNGSSDRTASVASEAGARVVLVAERGYGAAYLGGFKEARGDYLIMGDADDSYDFGELEPFYRKLAAGYEFVMGNRFQGTVERGAMPALHRYLGTPVLTWIMNLLFRTGIGDVNCGMRGLVRRIIPRLRLKAAGMEFATEMIVKASLVHLRIAEVPCNLYRDKRDRRPHLRTWADGWRHLRFMLLFSPNSLFLVPGAALFLAGLLMMSLLTVRDILAPGALVVITQKHMVSSLLLLLIGAQVITFWIAAKLFTYSKYFDEESRLIMFVRKRFRLETCLLAGIGTILSGAAVFLYLAVSAYSGSLPYTTDLIRFDLAIFAFALVSLGVQTVFSSFLISFFFIKVK